MEDDAGSPVMFKIMREEIMHLFVKLNGHQASKTLWATGTQEAIRSAVALPIIFLFVLAIASRTAPARGLRPIIAVQQPADVANQNARLHAAEQSQQALKFVAPDLMNIETQLLSGRRSTVAPGVASAAPSGGNPATRVWETL